MQLSDQWVLVTGGARGLGQAITRAVAREGAGVVINYHRSAQAAQALAEELGPRAIALQADVTDAAAVRRHGVADSARDVVVLEERRTGLQGTGLVRPPLVDLLDPPVAALLRISEVGLGLGEVAAPRTRAAPRPPRPRKPPAARPHRRTRSPRR